MIECLRSVGVLLETDDYTADGLMRRFADRVTDKPERGALVFYLDKQGKSNHVVICLEEQYQIGASGGGSTTRNEGAAWRDNAFVKIRPTGYDPTRMRVVCLLE